MRYLSIPLGTFIGVALSACTGLAPKPTAPIVPTAVPPKVVVQVVPVPQPAKKERIIVVEQAPAEQPIVGSYVGKTIDDVIKALGQPIGSADMGNDVQAFQFYAKPKKPKCVASYLAKRENDTKPWIVEEYIAPDPKTCN